MSSFDKVPQRRPNWLIRLWRILISPSKSLSVLVLVLGGLIAGAIVVAAAGMSLHLTSTNAFCTSCHADNAAVEWQRSPHYANPAGFVAGCSDCHEPRAFFPQLIRKMRAFDEVWNQMIGTISTPEKYEAHRQDLAQREWDRLRADNSQECRNCHQTSSMVDNANPSLMDMHKSALASGQTCIDCHQGVAHKSPSAAK